MARGIRSPDHPAAKSPAARLFRLPPEAERDPGDDAAIVTTPPSLWSYALEMPPDLSTALSSDRCRVTIAVRALAGRVGIGIETKDRRDFFCSEMTAPEACGDWQLFHLVTPPLGECGWLIIRNVSQAGCSRALVRLVEIENLSPVPDPAVTGGPIDPQRRLAVVWGDATVCGTAGGWPLLLDNMLPGYQFLNGGLAADAYDAVLRRAIAFNRDHHVALNIVLPGWHHLARNEHIRSDLLAALPHIKNPVMATMPTALNGRIIKHDLSRYFVASDDNDTCFCLCESQRYSIELQRELFAHITERNRIICEVAVAAGLPLLDLFGTLGTEHLADFREDFLDAMHPRPAAYEKLARAVCAGMGVIPRGDKD